MGSVASDLQDDLERFFTVPICCGGFRYRDDSIFHKKSVSLSMLFHTSLFFHRPLYGYEYGTYERILIHHFFLVGYISRQ